MKKILIVSVLIMLMAVSAFGADYTISTSAKEETGLTYVVAKVNAQRALQKLSPLTNKEYLTSVMADVFKDYIRQSWGSDINAVNSVTPTKWGDLTDNQRTQIKTILGIPTQVEP